jgi:diguanylate cyclase (GGDEF)-like protein
MNDPVMTLQSVHAATLALGDATDQSELGDLTCQLVGEHLSADAVELQLAGNTFRWSSSDTSGPSDGLVPLETPLGRMGDIRWWRSAPLSDSEKLAVEVIAARAAIGLEHAQLLDAAEVKTLRDPLTGVLNRAGALQSLSEMTTPYAVALLDVDRLSGINERFGRDAGDRVLQRLAMVLLQGRFGDVVARWSGEEFLVALPNCELEGATSRMRRVLERVQETVRAGVAPVTFSCGVAMVHGDDGIGLALTEADCALASAKASGPGTVRSA